MTSPVFIFIFRYYVRLLFYRRFKNVWLDQQYIPDKKSSTLYFLNHNSWWDGIVPLLLNEFRFRQHARAIMDEEQLEKYPFFRKLGTYGMDRDNSRKALKSLHKTVCLLKNKGTSVFIYPQGKLVNPFEPITFESGIVWLYDKCEDVDFVPIVMHQHSMFSDKPELFIKVGHPLKVNDSLTKLEKRTFFESALRSLLEELWGDSVNNNHKMERLV